MNNITRITGERIRYLRNSKRWSQEELAHRANMHPSYIGSIERGEKSITIESLEKVINALNINFEEFFRFTSSDYGEDDASVLFKIIEKLRNRNINDQKMVIKFLDIIIPWKDNA